MQSMLPLKQNEVAALQFVLKFVSLEEILISTQKGFDESEKASKTEKADVCWKAVEAFLK